MSNTHSVEAKELVAKFSQELDGVYGDDSAAKQCALICVDEIIKVTPMYTGNLNPNWIYWREVRTAIEQL